MVNTCRRETTSGVPSFIRDVRRRLLRTLTISAKVGDQVVKSCVFNHKQAYGLRRDFHPGEQTQFIPWNIRMEDVGTMRDRLCGAMLRLEL